MSCDCTMRESCESCNQKVEKKDIGKVFTHSVVVDRIEEAR